MGKQIRLYQQEAIDSVFKYMDEGGVSGIITLATGLGKTFVAVNILNNPRFNKVLWLTHSEELIEQSSLAILKEEFDEQSLFEEINQKNGFIAYLDNLDGKAPMDLFDGLTHQETKVKGHLGIIKQHRLDTDCKIVVASVQTIVRRLEKLPKDLFDLVVVDECHMACSNTFTKVCNHFKGQFLLGLTATPVRTDGMSLSNLFDKIIIERDIKFGIDNGYLCEIDAVRVKTDLDIDSVRTTAGELNSKDLENLVNTPKRNNLIVDKYLEYGSGRQALAFCVDVKHAMDLAQVFNNRGINASFVVGDESLCPDRKARVDLFRSKELQVLCNVNILIAGVDIPDTNCIIAARPTKSLVLYMQSIGRGTRLKSDGGNLLLLDIVDNTSKHQLINTWTLDKGKPLEDKIFMTKEKKSDLIEKREQKRKIDSQVKKDVKVDLMKLPEPPKIAGAWMKDAPSEKQLAWLERLGYDIVNNTYTKGQCSELISASQASQAQINALKNKGYDVSQGVTVTQAQMAFATIANETNKSITKSL